MMSGVPLETRWDFNKFWNNKFYYKAAYCWISTELLSVVAQYDIYSYVNQTMYLIDTDQTHLAANTLDVWHHISLKSMP